MQILKFFAAFLLVVATPAFAKDGYWVVTQRSGDVRVLKPGLQPASAQVRATLSPGDVVATGTNGRAMLTKGDDYVVVAPGSRLVLPKEEQAKGFTRLIQQVGTMLYKVKHTGVPHFAVETPMLAAVVKGTSFTVIVDDKRAAVQVTDGLVEVSSNNGTARRLVERGMTVYVGRERLDAIIEMKPGASDAPVTANTDDDAVKVAGSGDVPVSAIAELTGGLVREAPATAAVVATRGPAEPVAEVVNASAPVPDVAVDVIKTVAPVAEPVEPVTGVVTPVVEPIVEIVPPVATPVAGPVVAPVVKPIVAPVVKPVVTPIVEPVVAPIVEAVVTPVVEPVVTPVVAPVVEPVVTPIVEAVVAPVVEPVVTPIVEAVVTPIVEPVVTPIVEAVVTPIVEPVMTPVVTPIVAPVVTPIVSPIVEPVSTLLPGLGGVNL